MEENEEPGKSNANSRIRKGTYCKVMRVKYRKHEDGEAIRLNLDKEDWCIACCDCGLVHLLQFHHIKGNTWDIAAFRQPRRTGQLRRHKYGNLQKGQLL